MVRIKNKIISALLAVISLVPIAMFIETFSTSLIDHSIARSHEIERVFVDAAKLTHDFYVTHARLPTQEEFRALVSISEEDPLMYSPPPFDASMVAKAGKPPPSGFVLDYWRGEWMEQYISWTKQSTLKFDASEYFLFHSQLIQAAFMFGLSLLCVAMSVWTWPNKTAATAFGQNFDSTE